MVRSKTIAGADLSCAGLMRFSLFIFFLLNFFQTAGQQIPSVLSGSEVVVEDVVITGNRKTHEKIILRELSVQKGQLLPADSLETFRRLDSLRLATAGLFTYIHIQIDTLNSSTINWNIHVRERWFVIPEPTFQLADRNFNVWWNEQNRDIRRAIIGVTVRHKNFRGRLENLIATIQVGYTKRFALEYQKPYLDREQKHGLGIGFSVAESQETYYTTDSNRWRFIRSTDRYILRQYEGYLGYIYRPAYATRHILRVGYKHYFVDDTVRKLNADYYNNAGSDLRMLEFTYRLEQNKTDNWNYPLKGTKLIAQLISRVGLEGFDHQSFATLELGKYYNPYGRWYISSIFRGRLSFPQEQPYALRTALGGKFDYVRGYEYYVIDGSHFGLVRLNLKRELLNINIGNLGWKYLPVIPIRIYPKIFADAGYVHNTIEGNSFLNNRMLYAAGFGLDIFTFYDIKIRLEYVWNHLGQKDLFLHFNSE